MNPTGCATPTLWTQVIEAMQKDSGEDSGRALKQFCEQYRPLIVGFLLQRGWQDQAEDLAHDFLEGKVLAGLAEREGFIHRARRGQSGSFRAFLGKVLWDFHRDSLKKRLAQKAGGGATHVPLDEVEFAQLAAAPPSEVCHEVDVALARKVIDSAAGESTRSGVLLDYLHQRIGLSEGAARLDLSEGAFKVAVHRLLERLRDKLRAEVARLVGPDEHEISEELKYLLKALGQSGL